MSDAATQTQPAGAIHRRKKPARRKPKGLADRRTRILLAMLVLFALLGAATFHWGPAVLTMAALATVPLIFLFFVAISLPSRARP